MLFRQSKQGQAIAKKSGTERKIFLADFTLTIKDVTKTFVAPVHYQQEGDAIKLSSTFTINRLAFGIGVKSAILSEEVMVRLEAHVVN